MGKHTRLPYLFIQLTIIYAFILITCQENVTCHYSCFNCTAETYINCFSCKDKSDKLTVL